MKPVDEMTLDEIQDELAWHDGWEFNTRVFGCWSSSEYGVQSQEEHPIPANLDAAAELPEGWEVTIEQHEFGCDATAMNMRMDGPNNTKHADGPTELLARFRLRLAVLRATKKGGGNA